MFMTWTAQTERLPQVASQGKRCEHRAHMSTFSLSMLRASYGVGAGLFGGWFGFLTK